jgi:hypothetical protein
MEMERKTVHRGIVALAIVTSLSAAGSRPAAAMDLGFLDRLTHLWSFVTGNSSHAPRPATSRSHRVPQKATTEPGERGFGIDPNGLTTSPGTLPIGG